MSKNKTVQSVPNDFSGSKSNQIINETIAGIMKEETFYPNETIKKDLASENKEILMPESKRNPLISKHDNFKKNVVKRPFSCKFCRRKFEQINLKNEHEKTVHNNRNYEAHKSIQPLKTKTQTEKSFMCKICPVKFQHKHEAAPNKTIEKDAKITESQITEIVEERIVDINETTKSKKSKNEEDIILACKFCEKPFNDAGTLKFHETCHAHNDATPYSCKVESVQDWSFSVRRTGQGLLN